MDNRRRRAELGASFAGLPATDAGRGVTGLWMDANNPTTAAAVYSGANGARVFRTVDGGLFWDDVTADLPTGR
ncbi:MAG: hypothetical protein R2724_31090 [Bryobacterales bacterium]